MPKTEIDYSNTIIYKIFCKDAAINDVYVGHTTNFVQRKQSHKDCCINIKSPNHNCKVYQVIRANGGWNNWKMDIINFFDCKDHYEARKKEQEYFISLNATLNSIEPMPKLKVSLPVKDKKDKETFFCSTCKIYCNSSKVFEQHNKTKKHLKILQVNSENIIEQEKSQYKFSCTLCNYYCSNSDHDKYLITVKYTIPAVYKCDTCHISTSNKKDYTKHISTVKHQKLILGKNELLTDQSKHICSTCSKEYKSYVGLWKHKKICFDKPYQDINHVISEKNITETKDKVIEQLIKDNADFKDIILEFMKNSSDLQKHLIDICKNNSNI